MKRTSPGKYKTAAGELIQIRFFCTPSRENVNIRRSFDGKNFITVNTNSIQFPMENKKIVLNVQYAFILTGSCLNQILTVDNPPNNDDRITAQAVGGGTDLITLIFNP